VGDSRKYPYLAMGNMNTYACVASVSVGFRSTELQREKGASQRRGRGRGRKEGNTCRQTPGF